MNKLVIFLMVANEIRGAFSVLYLGNDYLVNGLSTRFYVEAAILVAIGVGVIAWKRAKR